MARGKAVELHALRAVCAPEAGDRLGSGRSREAERAWTQFSSERSAPGRRAAGAGDLRLSVLPQPCRSVGCGSLASLGSQLTAGVRLYKRFYGKEREIFY